MKFSYSETWAEAVKMLQGNLAIIAAIAGVFFFLPELLSAHFLPPPEQGGDPNDAMRMVREYYGTIWPWFLLSLLVKAVGSVSILMLLLKPRGGTVAALIAASLILVPTYFVATLLSTIAVVIGTLLLIAPGVYLLGRLALVGPVVAVEAALNPLTALSRSFEATKGNGWAVAGLLLLVLIPGLIAIRVAVWLLGSIFLLLAGKDLGALLAEIVLALGSAGLSAVVVALVAALYARLGGKPSTAAAAD